ncbi:hypothetical protein [Microbacterium sp. NC79]|uniref:hypothetical protein n=1 Tax=Microbacterium sp. NC79 TaxID=2851009 RepID=UPI001C2BA573|nr:hypothetical protein [Microbacterium sp. NC79]MBV0894627.1 hypothetical protein [Microbacterium sp. NC79]
MSALRPDEEAELGRLARQLFARGAEHDEAAAARYAQLDSRRRAAAGAVAPSVASAGAHMATTTAPEAASVSRAVVPEPFAGAGGRLTDPSSMPQTRPGPHADASKTAASGAFALVAEETSRADEQYAAIPELGELMRAEQVVPPRVRDAVAPSAVVASVSDKQPARAPQQPRSYRKQILSAAVGFALAGLVVGVVHFVTQQRPLVSGTAVPITLEQMPEMGEYAEQEIRTLTADGGTILQAEGVPDVSMIVVEQSNGMTCAYLWPKEDAVSEAFAQTCAEEYGPIVWDYPLELLRDIPRPQAFADLEFLRIIVKDREFSVWNAAPTERSHY